MPARAHVIDGRYRVEARLGRGGAGTVYAVHDPRTGERRALKRLETRFDQPSMRLRFQREFHTMAGLAHPQIVRVHDYGLDGERPYYTMELLHGQDAREAAPLAWAEAGAIVRDVASALAFLHARRLIHRDIGPRNVLCTTSSGAKVIDFGILATPGVAAEIAGTPMCMAPEALRGLPLDHRTDLYSLGVVAHHLLTGGYPYEGRDVIEVELAMSRGRRDRLGALPAGARALIEDLLALDPMRRPSSASAVIERLGALGIAPRADEDEAARGWLASAQLVGRDVELALAQEVIDGAAAGKGGVLILEAESGMGKSRLLREVALRAQVSGALTVRVSGDDSSRGPLGVVRAIAARLLVLARDQVLAAAVAHAPSVVAVLPELRRERPDVEGRLTGDHGEDRLRLQAELFEWLAAVATEAPLVLAIDDLQRADEASASFLSSLAAQASEHPVGMIWALRTDEPVRAPAALASIRSVARGHRLTGLSAVGVEQLVAALFGEMKGREALARSMAEVTRGAPMLCTVLARDLVDQGVIAYADGSWRIEGPTPILSVPEGLHGALRARLRGLGGPARRLAEQLALIHGEVSLELAVMLAGDSADAAGAFGALDELAFEEVLLETDQTLRFRHGAIREVLVAELDEGRRAALHRRAADALLASMPEGVERDSAVGQHLLAANEPARAAEHLERAAHACLEASSFTEAVPLLETVLSVAKQAGFTRAREVRLRHDLVRAAFIGQRDAIARHAMPTVQMLTEDARLDLARRWAPTLGGRAALMAALTYAAAERLTKPEAERPLPVRESLAALMVTTTMSCGVAAAVFDLEQAQALSESLEPFQCLGDRVPATAGVLNSLFVDMALGRYRDARRKLDRVEQMFDRDHSTPVSALDRAIARGSCFYTRACLRAQRQDSGYQDDLDRLAALDLRFYDVAGNVARVLYHRFRGEEQKALALEEAVSVTQLQMGDAWVFRTQLVWMSAVAFGYTRDAAGLTRSLEPLDQMRLQDGGGASLMHAITLGDALRERGDASAAVDLLRRTNLTGDMSAMAPLVHASLSEAELAVGALERARESAARAVEVLGDFEDNLLSIHIRAHRARAYADAAAGHPEDAWARLEWLLAKVDPLGSPSASGTVHEALARIASLQSDAVTFSGHRDACARWFFQTENRVLIQRADRLRSLMDRGPSPRQIADAVTVITRPSSDASRPRSLDELLARVCEETSASRAFVYVAAGLGAHRLAPRVGVGPPDEVVRAASLRFVAARSDEVVTTIAEDLRPPASDRAWRILPLPTGGSLRAVVVLAQGAGLALRAPTPSTVARLAEATQLAR